MSPRQDRPAPPSGSFLAERMRLVLAMIARDLGQIHRHGLVLLLVLSFVLFIGGLLITSMASSEFDWRGEPTWTGSVILPAPFPEIQADRLAGQAPLTVNFEATVTGGNPPFTYEWVCGRRSVESDKLTYSHTFEDPGEYECYISVKRGDRSQNSSSIRIVVVGEGEIPLDAFIYANVTEGSAPLSVAFSSAVVGGTPPYDIIWDFADGTNTSEENPVHLFTAEADLEVVFNVTDAENATLERTVKISTGGDEEEGGVPFTLLDMMFGLAVIITMVIIPLAFSTGYKHEMKRGTVRTLVCYPVGVLGVTVAKLLYAAIVGFILAGVVFLLPTGGTGKPFNERFLVFLVAYLLTMLTVTIGALAALALSRGTRKMYVRPTSFPYLFVILGFLFTQKIIESLGWILSGFGRGDYDSAAFAEGFSPIIALSPYHLGGEALAASLDGVGSVSVLIVVVPAVLIILGAWVSRGVYPDIFVKE